VSGAPAAHVAQFAWPEARIGDAMRALAHACGLAPRDAAVPSVAAPVRPDPAWLEHAVTIFADWLGIEAEPTAAALIEAGDLVSRAAPMIVRLPRGGVLAIARARGSRVAILGPDHRVHRVEVRDVSRSLVDLPERADPAVEAVLAAARVPPRRTERARSALLAERMAGVRLEGCWMLRAAAGCSFRAEIARAHLPRRAAWLLVAHTADIAFAVSSWWALGEGALQGRVVPGWLAAWVLFLLTSIPLHASATRAQGLLAVDLGVLLDRRLLAGALRVDRDKARTEGTGQLLGRVLESEAVHKLASGGAVAGVLAAVELLVAACVLGLGAAAGLELPLLSACMVAAIVLGLQLHRRQAAWTDVRLALTHDTIERMVGHRTRVTQGRTEELHQEEDHALGAVLAHGRKMDGLAVALAAVVPRAWLVASLVALVPAFASPGRSTVAIGIALGGAMIAYRALGRATRGVQGLAGALVAWRRVRPLFEAAAETHAVASPHIGVDAAAPGSPLRGTLIDARDLVFRHRYRTEPLLRGVTIRIEEGDRVLLEGPSGSGKSTLAAILAGLREPQSGRLSLGGLDWRSLGSWVWRGRVVAVSQFHENHVLGASLAFNLLMGRRWPPTQADLRDAEVTCQELGLGDLLARMPAGLAQMVGETGWQLSHGERSRIYLARALLQEPDVVVLDESFAALDPATLRRAASCVLRRARTLVVVAHP
jgi:ATP-binding cassette subfamily B protein